MSPHHRRHRSPSRRPLPAPFPLLVLALIPWAAGCFSMRPVELSEIAPGEEVVVHLNVEASRRMSAEEGYDVRSVSGRLESTGNAALTVSIPVGRRVQGVMVDDTRRLFTLPRNEVVLVERREFNRNRSALVGGALLGGIIWGVLQISGDGGSGPDPGGEPPPPAPSIRFSVPLPR